MEEGEKHLTFHMCLCRCGRSHLGDHGNEIRRRCQHYVREGPEHLQRVHQQGNQNAKEENESNRKDDYTLIGSTIKTYVKVYKELGDKWINLTDNRVKELGITYKSTKNKAGLNTMPLITALLKIKEIQETFKTQDKTPGAIPSGVPSGRGPP